jgi:hypothetical protein
MRRFRFELDRDSYRAAQALAPLALSSCEPAVPPHPLGHSDEWHFEQWSHTSTHILTMLADGPCHLVGHCGMPDIGAIQLQMRPI